MQTKYIVTMIVLTLITVISCVHISIAINVDHLSNTGGDVISPKKIKYDVKNGRKLFEDYIQEHNKQYKNEAEFQRRYEIFVNNLIEINKMNQRSRSETYGITKFADMTVEEFIKGYTGLANSSSDSSISYPPSRVLDDVESPEEFDWRQKKVVTSVRDQLNCGSCWAFSTVGLVEGQHAIKHGELLSLSEQQLVDCWTDGGGCDLGSFPHWALDGASKMGGFMKLSDYPYTGVAGKCTFKKESVVVKLRGGEKVTVSDEEELKNLLYTYGPLSIGIFVGPAFAAYKGNVLVPSDSDCPEGMSANHAVLLVGYGSENGTPYWIIKNSWGDKWGEKGYLRIIRGKKACSVSDYVATGDIV